tara:strand:- start:35538 stop:36308 length:771 start_codon:yes stop_codon:yes gene_type:complete
MRPIHERLQEYFDSTSDEQIHKDWESTSAWDEVGSPILYQPTLTAIQIINKYKSLKLGLKHIVKTNEANYAPYHNIGHLLTVMKHCYYALEYMDMLDDDKAEALLLAALFHDYQHTQGELSDNINVIRSWRGLKHFLINLHPLGAEPLGVYDRYYDFMRRLIYSTEYPHVIKNEDLTTYQAILRDADMCPTFEYDWFKNCVFGISKEWDLDTIEFVSQSKGFVKGMNMITPYGKMVYKTQIDALISDYELYEEILQ